MIFDDGFDGRSIVLAAEFLYFFEQFQWGINGEVLFGKAICVNLFVNLLIFVAFTDNWWNFWLDCADELFWEGFLEGFAEKAFEIKW